MATQRDDRPRPLQSAQCSLCGIALPVGLMVPDGGRACADIRWYCKDAKSCTERWTARLPRPGHVAPTPREMSPGAGDHRPGGMPDPVPAELLGSAPEEALEPPGRHQRERGPDAARRQRAGPSHRPPRHGDVLRQPPATQRQAPPAASGPDEQPPSVRPKKKSE